MSTEARRPTTDALPAPLRTRRWPDVYPVAGRTLFRWVTRLAMLTILFIAATGIAHYHNTVMPPRSMVWHFAADPGWWVLDYLYAIAVRFQISYGGVLLLWAPGAAADA